MNSLLLASSSPRRRELLQRIVPAYAVGSSDVEARGSDLMPGWVVVPVDVPPEYALDVESHPTLWAWRKAVDVAWRLPQETADFLVLGADTVVIGEGQLLNKPVDEAHAVEMLRSLRGKKHYVATGYALVAPHSIGVETLHAGWVLSTVWMRDFSDAELRGYVATGEPLDKAGAYALQGLGGELVERVEGCYTNVVGLPLCAVRRTLEKAGVELLPRPNEGYCIGCPLVLGPNL